MCPCFTGGKHQLLAKANIQFLSKSLIQLNHELISKRLQTFESLQNYTEKTRERGEVSINPSPKMLMPTEAS
jgi:hypothetical protein